MGFSRKAPSAAKRKNTLVVADFMHMQEVVLKWNELAGNLDYKNLPRSAKGSTVLTNLEKTYHQLSHEEFFGKDELKQGIETNDLVMIADGLCDSVFTVFMWAVLSGEGLDHQDSMFLQDIEDEKDNYFDQPLAIDVDWYKAAIEKGDAFEAQTQLIILLQRFNKKIDIMEAFNKVCDSNFSKFPRRDSVMDVGAECRKIEEKGRYRGISAKLIDNDSRIVFLAREEVVGDNVKVYGVPKIVKSSQFRDVQNLAETIRK